MNNRFFLILTVGIIITAFFMIPTYILFNAEDQNRDNGMITLPPPEHHGEGSVGSAIQNRRSVRNFQSYTLPLTDVGELLWAGQGITQQREIPPQGWPGEQWPGGFKSAPSAGALYPLELYVLTGDVSELDVGFYRYISRSHSLDRVSNNISRKALVEATGGQSSIQHAGAIIIITGIYDRTELKYGDRAERYVHMECGAAAQNIYLMCESLGLGTVFIGAFRDDQVKKLLQLDENEHPLGIMPVGKPAS